MANNDQYVNEFEEINIVDKFPGILEFSKNYLLLNQPFLCKGCIKQWPAYEKWQSDDYLRNQIGDLEVKIEKRVDGKSTFAYFQKEYLEENMLYSEFLDRYQNYSLKERYYYANQNIPEKLLNDIKEPEIGNLMNFHTKNIWQSAGGSESLAHTDGYENFLCQVTGHKNIVLIPPTQRKYLYLQEGVSNYSPINFFSPDLEKYPIFQDIKGKMQVKLEAGDALYLPSFWWHHIISSKQRSIAINYWYVPHFMQQMFFAGIEEFKI